MILFGIGCSKGGDDNPFDVDMETATEQQDTVNIDANSIVGLHQNIFKPTCANAGCHDGTFEPDFRTIESSRPSI